MPQLAWSRAGPPGGPAIVLLHDWAGDRGAWVDAGALDALAAAGVTALACDLPGHGASAELAPPDRREPSAWAADAVAADLRSLGVREVAVAGLGDGGMVAGRVALGGEAAVTGLGLVARGPRPTQAARAEAAAALLDPGGRLWSAEASALVARARGARGADRRALADWLRRAAWPSAARLGAVDLPVVVLVGAEDPDRERAPATAAIFRHGRLVTVPGADTAMLASPELHEALRALAVRG